MIRTLIQEAVDTGARRWRACEILGLSARTVERWGANDEDGRHGPNHAPANKLSEVERQKAVDVMTSPEFRDCSPKQIVPALATRGQYIGSEPTLYRILHALNMQHARGRERAPMSRPREYVADGPMQVAAWDITYLRSLVRGIFFYLYLVEDVWSRTIIGWAVHEIESADLAAALIEKIRRETPGRDLKGWVLHADNGGPMKGATMLATLQRLGVVSSFSRPSVSDDNAYAESLFRTMKYRAKYPSTGFATVEDASLWVRDCLASRGKDRDVLTGVTSRGRHVADATVLVFFVVPSDEVRDRAKQASGTLGSAPANLVSPRVGHPQPESRSRRRQQRFNRSLNFHAPTILIPTASWPTRFMRSTATRSRWPQTACSSTSRRGVVARDRSDVCHSIVHAHRRWRPQTCGRSRWRFGVHRVDHRDGHTLESDEIDPRGDPLKGAHDWLDSRKRLMNGAPLAFQCVRASIAMGHIDGQPASRPRSGEADAPQTTRDA